MISFYFQVSIDEVCSCEKLWGLTVKFSAASEKEATKKKEKPPKRKEQNKFNILPLAKWQMAMFCLLRRISVHSFFLFDESSFINFCFFIVNFLAEILNV